MNPKLAFAQSLMQQPVGQGWGAIGGAGQQIVGALLARRAMDEDKAQQADFGKMLSGFDPSQPNAPQALATMLMQSENPRAQEAGTQLLSRTLMGSGGDPESYFAPTPMAGPGGTPVMVQASNRGNIRPVQGYSPIERPDAAVRPMHLGGGIMYDPSSGRTFTIPGVQEAATARAHAGASNVDFNPTIYNKEEGAGLQKMFEGVGNRIEGQQQSAADAARTAARIRQLNQELEGVPSGMGADARTFGLKALNAVGLAGPDDQAELAKREAAHRISGEMNMEQLNAMKGPATEKEYERLVKINPSILNTPQGRAEMEYIANHQAARQEAVAKAQAQIANEIQQRNLPIGEAQNLMRQAAADVNAQFDNQFRSPASSGAASRPAAPAPKAAAPAKSSSNSLKDMWDSFK